MQNNRDFPQGLSFLLNFHDALVRYYRYIRKNRSNPLTWSIARGSSALVIADPWLVSGGPPIHHTLCNPKGWKRSCHSEETHAYSLE